MRTETNSPTTAPSPTVPTQAPTVTPVPEQPEQIDVWEMPDQGLQWCDCGKDCEITIEQMSEEFWYVLGGMPEWVTHRNLCRVIQQFWQYISVCNFFFDHVAFSAKQVYGKTAEKYPYTVAVDIAGYFSKTWNGCPEESCEGGLNWSDLD